MPKKSKRNRTTLLDMKQFAFENLSPAAQARVIERREREKAYRERTKRRKAEQAKKPKRKPRGFDLGLG